LLFNHTDASGASIRATKVDGSLFNDYSVDDSPAELDPKGGNMGISTPYITINPLPPDPENWNYLYNESPMYVNGQRVSFTLDGISITQSYAMMYIESGRIGGQFGLLYMAAEASAQRVKLGTWWRTTTYSTTNPDTGDITSHTEMTKLNDVFGGYAYNNWSASLALTVFFQQDKKTKLGNKEREDLKAKLSDLLNKKDSKCKEFLNSLLVGLRGSIKNDFSDLAKEAFEKVSFFDKQMTGALGYAPSTIDSKDPEIDLNFAAIDKESKELKNLNLLIQTLIHEIIHAAKKGGNTTYSHNEMARRAYSVAKDMDLIPSGVEKPPTVLLGSDPNDVLRQGIGGQDVKDSMTFRKILENICK
jgi:hypothetical protein